MEREDVEDLIFRERINDIKEWCKKDLYSLTISAQDRKLWKETTKVVLDTLCWVSPWIMMMMMKLNFIILLLL